MSAERDPLAWIDQELATLDALGLRRRLVERRGAQGPVIEVEGVPLVNFGSNDYLGLAASAELRSAVQAALESDGWGSGASPLVTGRGEWHARLEQAIADFEETEAALLFPSGFAANVGAIAALAGKGDLILSDAKNHASLIDGCRLAGAQVRIYPHVDMPALEKYLAQAGGFRRRLIVTDSLFSMDGDLAPLDVLADLAERFNAMLLVDEAHATGVFGEHGRGGCEHFGVESRVAIRVGTLSKALGSSGGFVVGQGKLVEWLANRARPYVFSTAAPGPLAAAGLAALEVVRREPERRQRLLKQSARLRGKLASEGWQVGESASQIVPLFLGSPDVTMDLAARLRAQGFWVPGIRPPTVPDGESLLRISLTSEHTPKMVDSLCEALGRGRGPWR
ncbi:MAG: 8-amino-7-oxononanoate synthase [Pirellulales bacterium]